MQPIDILLVEDNEGDILLTKDTLQDLTCVNKIFVVKDGLAALNYLLKKDIFKNSSTPDLVLLDINLPKLSGQEVLKQIRSHNNIKHIPVVMLSTSSSSADVSESLKNGANCYFTKPIIIDDFIKKILAIEELGTHNKHFSNS